MSPKEKKALRLNVRLLNRLEKILGRSLGKLGLERAKLIREGKVMLVVANNVYCSGCKKRHRTLLLLCAPPLKPLRKLFKK